MMNDLHLRAARSLHDQRLAAALAEHEAHEHPRPRRQAPRLRQRRSG